VGIGFFSALGIRAVMRALSSLFGGKEARDSQRASAGAQEWTRLKSEPLRVLKDPQMKAEVKEAVQEIQDIRVHMEAERANLSKEQRLVLEFEHKVAQTAKENQIHDRLVKSIAEVAKSPVLFFKFDANKKAAYLTQKASLEQLPFKVSSQLSFEISDALLLEIFNSESKGRWVSLSQYTPLSHLVLKHFGVAHFEAWPVTTFQPSQQTPSRVVGVIVIVQAGVDSALHRESVAKLLRLTGRAYQTNELI
jgi:hypothetical protein